MNISSFDLNLLVAFDALLTERSVTRAAHRLGLSQPAVSNALARLRDGVGDSLFERTRHGMAPTPRALAMAEPVRAAMSHLQRALVPAADGKPPRRELRIAANVYAQLVVLPLAASGLESAPQPIALDVHASPGHAALTVDWRDLSSRGPSRMPILRSRLSCVIRRGNRAVGRSLGMREFLRASQVAVRSSAGRPGDGVDFALSELGERREVAVSVEDFVSAGRIASKSDLLAVIPRVVADQFRDELDLRVLNPPMRLSEIILEVSWSRASADDSLAMWFKNQLVSAGRLLSRSSRS